MSDESQPLWRFIPLAEYTSPAGPTTETVRNSVREIMRRLRLSDRAEQTDAVAQRERELKSIPAALIAQAAPHPNWRALHLAALSDAYQSWLDTDARQAGLCVLVNAPHSRLPHSARSWATDNNCHIIEPPAPQQILDGDSSWLAQMKAMDSERWVLPSLERCFLRHQNGLNLLRSWLDWAAGQPAGLILCDSWAWAFLSQTIHLDQIWPAARTLEPFNADALHRWFRRMAAESSTGTYTYTFRLADSGKLVYTPVGSPGVGTSGNKRDNGGANGQEVGQEETDYLKHLAARSRGTPEIAWQIWQHGLLVERESEVEESAEEKASMDQGRTIWVRPWDQLNLPAVPGRFGSNEALVLHALLLHDGLSDALLSLLLPLMPFETAGCLARLQAANLVVNDTACRRVTGLGYLAVRGFLRSEGFLTDEL